MRRISYALAALIACGGEPGTPPAPPPAPPTLSILSFEASPQVLSPGEGARLSWRAPGAERISITAEPGGLLVWALTATQGEALSKPLLEDTVFVLQAQMGDAEVTAQSTVRVSEQAEPSISVFLVSPPLFDGPGVEARVLWRAEGALQLTANGAPVEAFDGSPEGELSLWIERTTRFQLIAQRGDAQVRSEASAIRTAKEVEPNDRPDTASALFEGEAEGLLGEGDVDHYEVFVPEGGSVFARLHDGQEGCSIDARLSLQGPAPDVNRLVAVGAPSDSCAVIDPQLDPAARQLSQGRYTLAVRRPTLFGATGAYALSVTITPPGCGNGLVEPPELCDGEAFCGGNCQVKIQGSLQGPDRTSEFSGPGPQGQLEQVAHYAIELTEPGVLHADVCGADRIQLFHRDLPGPGGLRSLAESAPFGPGCHRAPAVRAPAGRYLLRVHPEPTLQDRMQLFIGARTPGCGDGLLEGEERCDDRNQLAGDGCSPACEEELEAALGPTGGSVKLALGPAGATPRAVSIPLNKPGQSISVSLSGDCAAPSSAPVGLRLLDDREMLGELRSTGGCAQLDPHQHDFARDLAVGVYRVQVFSETPLQAPAVTAQLEVTTPECGNGLLERRAQELCDDANTLPADGCDSSCFFETAGRIDAPAAAPGQSTVLNVPLIRPAERIRYELLLSAEGQVGVQQGVPLVNRCDNGTPQGELTLMDDALRPIFTSPLNLICPRLGAPQLKLPAGRYYIELRARNPMQQLPPSQLSVFHQESLCGDGVLGFGEQCDDGGTVAGDGCATDCRWEGDIGEEQEPNTHPLDALPIAVSLGSAKTVTGQIYPASDVDLYRFTLPAGPLAALEAVTYTALSRPDECPFGQDTFIELLDAQQNVLAQSDVGGAGECAALDGPGLVHIGAWGLSEGTYYLRVQQPTGLRWVERYLLDVRLE